MPDDGDPAMKRREGEREGGREGEGGRGDREDGRVGGRGDREKGSKKQKEQVETEREVGGGGRRSTSGRLLS